MEEIQNNISRLDWWFNGLFFVIIGAIIPFLSMKVFPFIGSFLILKPVRLMKARRLRKIKNIRWSPVRISYESSKCAGLLAAFITSVVFLMISMLFSVAILSSIQGEDKLIDNIFFFKVVEFSVVPVIFVEVLYFRQKLFFSQILFRLKRINIR